MHCLSYHCDHKGRLDLIELPMGASWRPMWRGKDRKMRRPVYVEVLHSTGGRIPKAHRRSGDLDRLHRRHSRLLLKGNLNRPVSKPFIIILQDDDFTVFAETLGQSITDQELKFGQFLILHHEIGHILLLHSQKQKHQFATGQMIMEEGYCDAFAMALTLAQTKDYETASRLASIRANYLDHRMAIARENEIKALRPGRGTFKSRYLAGEKVLASLNYIFCRSAMNFVLEQWRMSPWEADVGECSRIAMKWSSSKGIGQRLGTKIAEAKLRDLIATTGGRRSFAVQMYLLQREIAAMPREKSPSGATFYENSPNAQSSIIKDGKCSL